MRLKTTENPDVMTAHPGAGCASLFLLVFGLLLVICVFIPAETRGGDEFPWYIGIPIGGGMLAWGLYRRSIVLDRAAGTIETCSRIAGFTLSRKTQDLKRFEHVGVTPRVQKTDNSSHTVYPVTLVASGTVFELGRERLPNIARSKAEQLAKFLRLPLHDATSGKRVVRAAESLDESIGQRASRTGERAPLPDVPDDLSTQFEVTSDSAATLRIPAAGWSLRWFLPMLPFWLFGGWFIWMFQDFYQQEDTGELLIGLAACVTGVLAIVVSLLPGLVYCTRRVVVTASAERVEVVLTSLLGRRTRTIAADDIEELSVEKPFSSRQARSVKKAGVDTRGGGVTLRTDRETIAFGGHLPDGEQQFIERFLRTILEG